MATNLDANATYGLLDEVKDALHSMDLSFLNPSSIHSGGQKARALIEEARSRVASMIGLSSGARIVFTSGATESNNYALHLALDEQRPAALIISAIEHPALRDPALRLEKLGVHLSQIPPDEGGNFHPTDFAAAVRKDTKLVSVMLANNETGQILPVKEISAAVKAANPGVLVHSDAVQALAKIPVSWPDSGCDLMSLSGHKIGALSGVGALVVSDKINLHPLFRGGSQETRWRAGTENVLGIISFGIAAKVMHQRLRENAICMQRHRDYLWERLQGELPGITRTVSGTCLPNTLSIRIPGIHADDLVVAADLEGVCVSSGAACASGKPEPSPVLTALGLSAAEARSTLRISLRADYFPDELEHAADKLILCIRRMQLSRGTEAASAA